MQNKLLEEKLEQWRSATSEFLKHSHFHSVYLDEDIISIAPKSYVKREDKKEYDWMFLSIVHGVEVAGIEVQIRILNGLLKGSFKLGSNKVIFALGNVKAFLQSKRFLDHDLNRSFDVSLPFKESGHEKERAKVLAKYIQKSSAMLDLHQTRLRVETPFFIFPLDWPSLKYVASLNMNFPVVTHWMGSFSKDGLCSDEYAHRSGGVGFTLELGQNGFDEICIQAGVDVINRSLSMAKLETDEFSLRANLEKLRIYTWHSVVLNDSPRWRLVDGLYNFKSLKPGQLVLSKEDGHDPIFSPKETDIAVLFPQYPDEHGVIRSSELVRFIKPVSLKDIPGIESLEK